MREKRTLHKLSELDAIQIVTMYHLGKSSQSALARQFGVSSGYVSRLCHGAARPHVREFVEATIDRLGFAS